MIARIVSALSGHELDKGTTHFERSNLEFSDIDIGNPAINVIPGEARAQFNVRFNDVWTHEFAERAHSSGHQGSGAEREGRSRIPALERRLLHHQARRLSPNS